MNSRPWFRCTTRWAAVGFSSSRLPRYFGELWVCLVSSSALDASRRPTRRWLFIAGLLSLQMSHSTLFCIRWRTTDGWCFAKCPIRPYRKCGSLTNSLFWCICCRSWWRYSMPSRGWSSVRLYGFCGPASDTGRKRPESEAATLLCPQSAQRTANFSVHCTRAVVCITMKSVRIAPMVIASPV